MNVMEQEKMYGKAKSFAIQALEGYIKRGDTIEQLSSSCFGMSSMGESLTINGYCWVGDRCYRLKSREVGVILHNEYFFRFKLADIFAEVKGHKNQISLFD